MPNRRQAITTNAEPVHWRIYAALGGDTWMCWFVWRNRQMFLIPSIPCESDRLSYLINYVTDNGQVAQGVIPGRKVHGASMGPTWVLSAPDGPHFGPMNLANTDVMIGHDNISFSWWIFSSHHWTRCKYDDLHMFGTLSWQYYFYLSWSPPWTSMYTHN